MLFKIFLYFLYIMNLSIYIVVAFYISKGNLDQVVSGFGVQILSVASKMGRHCSALTGTVAGLTFVDPR